METGSIAKRRLGVLFLQSKSLLLQVIIIKSKHTDNVNKTSEFVELERTKKQTYSAVRYIAIQELLNRQISKITMDSLPGF